MPRINSERLLRFMWVAWHQDDYGDRNAIALGLTEEHARRRCLRRLG